MGAQNSMVRRKATPERETARNQEAYPGRNAQDHAGVKYIWWNSNCMINEVHIFFT